MYGMSRDRIFEAAKATVAQDGFSGLTIRKVAKRAGMSPMALYHHFADKDALLNALMDDGFAAWEMIVRSIRTRDPMRWLEQLIEAFLAFALAEPRRFDAAFFLPGSQARQYPDDFVAGRSPAIAMIIVRIDQAKAAGRIGDKSALDVALALSALGQGMVSMQRANRFTSDKQFKTLFRTTLRHALESFAAKPAGRTR
jgi:AcrR family transcriptional regulator